jgi:hypothetical protein
LSGRQTHESLEESLEIDLPEKASTVVPDAATLLIAFDVCKKGLFEKEAIAVWEYGQNNDDVVFDANILTSYVEALASFGKNTAADFAVKMIRYGVNGRDMPWRNVKPDTKVIKHAADCLRKNGWAKQATELDGIVVRVVKPNP